MNLTLPVITTCKVVTYKRKGIAKKEREAWLGPPNEEGRFKYLLVVLLSANHTRYF